MERFLGVVLIVLGAVLWYAVESIPGAQGILASFAAAVAGFGIVLIVMPGRAL